VGGGKLQVATAATTSAQVGLALPEALVAGLPDDDSGDLSTTAAGDILDLAQGAATVLLGPGLMDPDAASDLLREVVPKLAGPVVVDALGSAYLTRFREGLHHLEGQTVLTVNPTELARTLRIDDPEVTADPVAATVRLAKEARTVVLCGGKRKIIASPEGETWQVLEGGPGLGVAGSGDVQAGFVAGLLARGAEPAQAAVWGGYLHAVAGDRLAEEVGPLGFLARELPAMAPRLLADLTG
jgi:hydroxyethylthiazole kinase-like uncharacterized protein yjeF